MKFKPNLSISFALAEKLRAEYVLNKLQNLDPKFATDKEGAEDFTCAICDFVVSSDISACNWCDKVFCKSCIETWRKKEETCPSCKKIYVKSRTSRILINFLNRLEFSCQHCQNKFRFAEKTAHLIACAEMKSPCPFKPC
jgi:hypothetical protein